MPPFPMHSWAPGQRHQLFLLPRLQGHSYKQVDAPITETSVPTPLLVCLQALIAAGGLVTLFTRRKQVTTVAVEDEVKELGVGRGFGAALVLLWGGLLVASIIARSKTSYSDFKILHW